MRYALMGGFGLGLLGENVSQYVSPLAVFGEVDFLHAFREMSKGMLERAEETVHVQISKQAF